MIGRVLSAAIRDMRVASANPSPAVRRLTVIGWSVFAGAVLLSVPMFYFVDENPGVGIWAGPVGVIIVGLLAGFFSYASDFLTRVFRFAFANLSRIVCDLLGTTMAAALTVIFAWAALLLPEVGSRLPFGGLAGGVGN